MGKKCVPRDRLSKGELIYSTNLHHSETADVVLYPDSGGMFLIPFSFYYSNRIKSGTKYTKNGHRNSWDKKWLEFLSWTWKLPGLIREWWHSGPYVDYHKKTLDQNNRVKLSKLYGHLNQVPVLTVTQQNGNLFIVPLSCGYSFISR